MRNRAGIGDHKIQVIGSAVQRSVIFAAAGRTDCAVISFDSLRGPLDILRNPCFDARDIIPNLFRAGFFIQDRRTETEIFEEQFELPILCRKLLLSGSDTIEKAPYERPGAG